MARALIVGCGCAARGAGRLLVERGWQVRGTSRSAGRLREIETAGIEPSLADPARVGTVVELLGDVTVLIWALGSAAGPPADVRALHGPRLERMLEKLVDTPVRGFLYEAAGTAPRDLLEAGAGLVRGAERRWRIPVAVIRQPRDEPRRWAESIADAAEGLLGL